MEPPNLLKLLVPEVGIPSIHSGQAHRHGVETPRDFESENGNFSNPLFTNEFAPSLLLKLNFLVDLDRILLSERV